jgi:hypothetical protein
MLSEEKNLCGTTTIAAALLLLPLKNCRLRSTVAGALKIPSLSENHGENPKIGTCDHHRVVSAVAGSTKLG